MPKAKKKTSMLKKKAKKAPQKKASLKRKPIKKVAAKRKPKKVLAVPKGYTSITPYLIVNNAMQAVEFYKKIFGAKVSMRMERPGGKIAHAELKIGDAKIMLADECPEMDAHSPQAFGGAGMGIHLYIKNVDAVVERAVANGAKLLRAVENMFYGDRSGAVEDPYGHRWFIATHIEDVTPAQMKKRAAKLFGGESV